MTVCPKTASHIASLLLLLSMTCPFRYHLLRTICKPTQIKSIGILWKMPQNPSLTHSHSHCFMTQHKIRALFLVKMCSRLCAAWTAQTVQLAMPAAEEVFRLRNCVVPIELKQPCRANGACPSASTGLGPTAAKEGGYPVSTPWSLGACKATNHSRYAAFAILLCAESVCRLQCLCFA